MESLKCCDTCRWFNRDGGRCQRRSPTENGWPRVYAEHYCGDYEQGEFVTVTFAQVLESRGHVNESEAS